MFQTAHRVKLSATDADAVASEPIASIAVQLDDNSSGDIISPGVQTGVLVGMLVFGTLLLALALCAIYRWIDASASVARVAVRRSLPQPPPLQSNFGAAPPPSAPRQFGTVASLAAAAHQPARGERSVSPQRSPFPPPPPLTPQSHQTDRVAPASNNMRWQRPGGLLASLAATSGPPQQQQQQNYNHQQQSMLRPLNKLNGGGGGGGATF